MVNSKFKKLFPMMLILMFGKPCFSGTMGEEAPYNGVYIGADIGLIALFNQNFNTINGTPPITAFSGTLSNQAGHFGLTGGGMLGYDYSLQKIKLGVEGYINGTSLSIRQSQHTTIPFYDAASTTTQENYAWGFRALPGYEVSPGIIPHLIFGYSNAQFTIKAPAPASGLTIFQSIINETFTRNGFQSGIGLTSIIYHNLSLRVDGLFTTYGTHWSPAHTYNNGQASPYTLDYTSTLKSVLNTFESNLTLSYKFA